jgi:hypothetical protein
MKRFLFTTLLFCYVFVPAQNLVPNYSFEQKLVCSPSPGGFAGYVADWTGQGGGGGLWYYTAECPTDSFPKGIYPGVPYDSVQGLFFGFQYARTGVSYAGMETFVNDGQDTVYPYTNNPYLNFRNYIEAKLTDSLQAGKVYYVTFFVNLSNTATFVCSDMGAYLSDSALNFNGTTPKTYLIPQIANDPKKQELSDTLNWMKISGSFKANGGEKYIIIGNFKNDSTSSTRYVGYTKDNASAYYYIDDVIVSTDSLEGVNELITHNDEQLKIFPNPSTGIFTFNLSNNNEKANLTIYNMIGENIYNTQFNTSTTQIDLSNKPAGIYLYRIVSEKGEAIANGKLVIE